MAQSQEEATENFLAELASNPLTALSYMRTMYSALDMCHEILYDLTWERGGKLDAHHEEHVIKLNRVVREILEKKE